MDSFFFHPKLVHLPMALAVLMPLISAGLVLAWWRGWFPPRAWVIALLLQALLVGSGVAALRSGEVDEERVESVVAERYIEAHEEMAETFVLAAGVVLALMLVVFVMAERPLGLSLAATATLGTLLVAGLGYRTGQAGGDLVYRHGAASVHLVQGGGAASSPRDLTEAREEDDEGDDDD